MNIPEIDEIRAQLNKLESRLSPLTIPPTQLPVKITQLTLSALDSYIKHEYSTIRAFNCNNTALLLLHPNGYIGIYDNNFQYYKLLPPEVNHSCRPRWSRTNPNIFTYFKGNELCQFDLAKDWNSTAISILYKFKQFTKIDDGGEADISEDGKYRAIVGDDKHVFLFDLENLSSLLSSSTTNYNPNFSLYLTPNNNVLIPSMKDISMFSKNMVPYSQKIASIGGHMDVGRDLSGNEILVWCNSADSSGKDKNPYLESCKNGIVMINLATSKQTCLLSLDWSLDVHISCPMKSNFCLVSTFRNNEKNPENQYTNKILKVFYDGAPAQILCPTNSRSFGYADNYNTQPKVSISQDGTKFVFDSNNEIKSPFQYHCDVFLGEF